MSKTPEEMAEEYGASPHEKDAFLAGYKAAMNENKPKVQELEANWKFCCEDKARLLNELAAAERAKEQVADVSKVMPHWISVKDRLPEDAMHSVVRTDDGEYQVAWRENGYWFMFNPCCVYDSQVNDVTHWMPLPELPKEEK